MFTMLLILEGKFKDVFLLMNDSLWFGLVSYNLHYALKSIFICIEPFLSHSVLICQM